MPELPEVETVCLALKPALQGKSLLNIQLNRSDLRFPLPFHMASELCQQPILNVRRRAKYLLIDFQHGITLIWHLGMSGRVIIEDLSSPFLKASRHDHVILTTCHNHRITYRDPRRFGFMLLAPTDNLEKQNPFNTLGPEPLDDIGATFRLRMHFLIRRLSQGLVIFMPQRLYGKPSYRPCVLQTV
jgi:formamidopyrimidine-DNA glycosylase